MISKLYGKEDGQEYEVQGFLATNNGQPAAVVLNTKTKRVSSMSLEYLDSLDKDGRADLEKKMADESMKKMQEDQAKLTPPNGQSGMSAKQAEDFAAKNGMNSQGQALVKDPETGKLVVDPSELGTEGVSSSDNAKSDESIIDKVKDKFTSKK